jgi:serpin B
MIEYSPDGSPWIGDVLHKTFIDVNETGTSAAAVTVVEIEAPGSAVDEPTKPPKTITIRLNRPFVYMIVNTKTNTPVFIGTVESMSE